MTLAARIRNYVLLLVGLGLMASPLLARTATADASAFTGFNFTADADGYTLTGGSPKSQAYPQVQLRVGNAQTKLFTGPSGYALSSAMWPGELAAGAGSLIALLGGPPEAAMLNWPVRAEAFAPAGPHNASMEPGMQAFADEEVAEAITSLDRVDDFEQITFDSITTHSRSEIKGETGVSSGRSEVTGISIAGGQVTIDAVVTEASASTDGVEASTSGFTKVTGLMIGGQEATVDQHGVHFGGEGGDPVDPVSQAIGENILSHLGMELFVTQPAESTGPGTATVRSGSLVIVWDVFSQGEGIGVFAIGGSGAFVRATQRGELPQLDVPDYEPPVFDSGSFSPTVGGTTFDPPAPAAAPPASTPPAPAAEPDQEIFATEPIRADFFDGIPPGLVLAAVAGALLAGRSLRRLHAAAILAPSHVCPLEDERP